MLILQRIYYGISPALETSNSEYESVTDNINDLHTLFKEADCFQMSYQIATTFVYVRTRGITDSSINVKLITLSSIGEAKHDKTLIELAEQEANSFKPLKKRK